MKEGETQAAAKEINSQPTKSFSLEESKNLFRQQLVAALEALPSKKPIRAGSIALIIGGPLSFNWVKVLSKSRGGHYEVALTEKLQQGERTSSFKIAEDKLWATEDCKPIVSKLEAILNSGKKNYSV